MMNTPSTTTDSQHIPCPTCQQPIYIHANVCDHCGRNFGTIKPWLTDAQPYWLPDQKQRKDPLRFWTWPMTIALVVVLPLMLTGTYLCLRIAERTLSEVFDDAAHRDLDHLEELSDP